MKYNIPTTSNGEFAEKIQALWQLLESSRHTVAFTGAGVSTLSGIQDFRGKNGLYKTMDAERMFDINIFRRDPSVYYTLSRDFIYGLEEKKPSVVHRVLAELEKRKMLDALITQNIDLLHQKAGSEQVIEVHGSPSYHYCRRCGFRNRFEDVVPIVRSGELPKCPECGTVLKPEIVFYGENLPAAAIDRAVTEARQADLMLVLGSSLVVYPAASLPEMTAHAGGTIVIVNDMPTYLDHEAKLHFDDLEETFTALERLLSDSATQDNTDSTGST